MMDRAEIEKQVREAIRPLATNYILGYLSNLKEFDKELKIQVDKVAAQILVLIPDEKEIREQEQTLREACRKALAFLPNPIRNDRQKELRNTLVQALKQGG